MQFPGGVFNFHNPATAKDCDMPKLLIVDDEQDILEFARRFFTKRGIDVRIAKNGEDALVLVKDFQPGLVLLDVAMDGISGLEVLKRLRADGSDVPVIMVTGIEDEATVNEANSWGVKGYIHKPLVLNELEKIVLAELKDRVTGR
jgi:DNA-binding response OmpR family regulator